MFFLLALCAIGIPSVLSAESQSSNYKIFADSFTSGGGNANSSNYYQFDTLGIQATGEEMRGLNYILDSGLTPQETPPYISFSLGGGTDIDLGTLSASSVAFGSHTMSVETNSRRGYSISYAGTALQHYTGYEFDSAGISSPAASSPGTEQFGLNAVANTNPAVGANPSGGTGGGVETKYAQQNQFAFQSGDIMGTGNTFTQDVTYTVSIIANIANSTPGGRYESNIVYTVYSKY